MKRINLESLVYLLAFVLLGSAIFIEALRVPTIDNSIMPHLDKMAHIAAFGLLAFLLFQFVRSAGFTIRWPVPAVVVLVVTILGIIDEWVQSFAPGRIASLGDGLSDVAGAGIAAFLCFLWFNRTRR